MMSCDIFQSYGTTVWLECWKYSHEWGIFMAANEFRKIN